MSLFVHHIEKCSFANGPGARSVLWVQGCSLNCPGCFNPETHMLGGVPCNPQTLAAKIAGYQIPGLTISGGEPLDQSYALRTFLEAFRQKSKATIFLFTGYTVSEILSDKKKIHTVRLVDAALCGRYQPGRMWLAKHLMLVSKRLMPWELRPMQKVELIVRGDHITVTGYPKTKEEKIAL